MAPKQQPEWQSALSPLVARVLEAGVAGPATLSPKAAPVVSRATWMQQCEYLGHLQALEAAVLHCAARGELSAIARSGELSSIVGVAIRYLTTSDQVSYVVVHAWLSVVAALTAFTKQETSLSHYIPKLADTVKMLAKDRCSSPASGMLYGSLLLLAQLMAFSPADLTLPLRALPHPLKTVDVAPRVAAMHLVPVLSAETTCRKSRRLDWETFGYLRKGMQSTDFAVREAAVGALRSVFAMGLGMEDAVAVAALDALMVVCEDMSYTSLKLQEDTGRAIGSILASMQMGHARPLAQGHDKPIRWDFFGGCTAAESLRTVRRILRTPMARTTQQVLGVALAEMLRVAVLPSTVMDAVTRVVELVSPTKQDGRAYMPRLVSSGLALWSESLASDTLRVLVVEALLQLIKHNRAVVQTALLSLATIVPHVSSMEDLSLPIFNVMRVVALRLPALGTAASDVAAALAWRNSRCERALLQSLYVASSNVSQDASIPLPSDFVLSARAVLAMPAAYFHRSSYAFEPLLAAMTYLITDHLPDRVNDAFYRRVDFFNQFAGLLLREMGSRVTPHVKRRIAKASHVFLSLLVSVPNDSSPFHRAVSSACALLGALGHNAFELKLVDALVQVQICSLSRGASTTSPAGAAESSLFTRMRRDCFRVVQRQPLARFEDGLRSPNAAFVLTELDAASDAGVPCAVDDATLLSPTVGGLMASSRRMVPSAVNAVRAEALAEGFALLAKYVVHSRPSDRDAAARTVIDKAMQILTSGGAPADRDALTQAASYVPQWNALCLLRHLLWEQQLHGTAAGCEVLWSTTLAHKVHQLRDAVAQRSLCSPVLDIQVLAATVYAQLTVLQRARSAATSKLVTEINSDMHRVSGNILALGCLHALPPLASQAAAVDGVSEDTDGALLPMATSYIAEALKNTDLMGDPCSIVAMSALCGLHMLVAAHPAHIRSVVAAHIVPVLLRPAKHHVMDPLIHHLLLALFEALPASDLPPCSPQSAATSGSGVDLGVPTLSQWLAHRAVSLRRHELSGRSGDAEVLEVVHRLTAMNEARVEPAVVAFYVAQGLRGCTTDAVLRAGAAVLCACARQVHAPEAPQQVGSAGATDFFASRSTVSRPTPSIAATVLLSSVASVDIRRIAAIVDSATTDETRLGWTEVGWLMLGSATQHQLIAALRDIAAVLQAKPAWALPGAEDRIGAGGLFTGVARVVRGGATTASAAAAAAEAEESMAGGTRDRGSAYDAEDFQYDDHVGGSLAGAASSSSAAAGAAASAAAAACALHSDITAKKVMLDLLRLYVNHAQLAAGKVLTLGTVMDVVLVGVALANALPMLVAPSITLLSLVLHEFGSLTQPVEAGRTVSGQPLLLPWKTQLLSGLKEAVGMATYSCGVGCDAVRQLLESNLADDNSVRRTLSALVALLNTLDDDDTAESNIALGASTRVILTLSEGLQLAEKNAWPQSARLVREAIQSPAGQALLAMLCERVTVAIALASGYEPAYDTFTTPLGDISNCSLESIVLLLQQTCEAVEYLGPTARHAAGCLTCLLVSLPGPPLRTLRVVVPKLSVPHQSVITTVALNLLTASAQSGGCLPAELEGDLLALASSTVRTPAKCVATVGPLVRLALLTLPAALPTAPVAGDVMEAIQQLLVLAMDATCRHNVVAELLQLLPTAEVAAMPDDMPVWSAVRAYAGRLSPTERAAFVRCNPQATLFALLDALGEPRRRGPSNGTPTAGGGICDNPMLAAFVEGDVVADGVLQRLQELMKEAAVVRQVAERVRAASGGGRPPHLIALLVSVMGSLLFHKGSRTPDAAPHTISSTGGTGSCDEETEWWDLLDELLAALVAERSLCPCATGVTGATPVLSPAAATEALHHAVGMFITMLATILCVADEAQSSGDCACSAVERLPKTGLYLMQTLVPCHSGALRNAITSLTATAPGGAGAAQRLKAFMQQCGTTAPRGGPPPATEPHVVVDTVAAQSQRPTSAPSRKLTIDISSFQ